MRTPRDAYPGAQTCCASPTRTPARLANSRRTWSRRRTRETMCVFVSVSFAHSFAYPAAGKFSRASSAGGRLNLRSNIEQSDRVGRRGLSEPREDFSRLNTYAFPWLLNEQALKPLPLTLLSACDISRGLALCFRQVVERDLLRTLKSFH